MGPTQKGTLVLSACFAAAVGAGAAGGIWAVNSAHDSMERRINDIRMRDALESQSLSERTSGDWVTGNANCPRPESQGRLTPDGAPFMLVPATPGMLPRAEVPPSIKSGETATGKDFFASYNGLPFEGTFCVYPTAAPVLVLKRDGGQPETYKMVFRRQP